MSSPLVIVLSVCAWYKKFKTVVFTTTADYWLDAIKPNDLSSSSVLSSRICARSLSSKSRSIFVSPTCVPPQALKSTPKSSSFLCAHSIASGKSATFTCLVRANASCAHARSASTNASISIFSSASISFVICIGYTTNRLKKQVILLMLAKCCYLCYNYPHYGQASYRRHRWANQRW